MNDIESDLQETKKSTMLLLRRVDDIAANSTTMMQSCLVYTPRPLRQRHYGPSGLTSTLIFNAPPRTARDTSAAQPVAFWERMVDAWRTSGPSMEGTRVHSNLVASSTKGLIASPASAESLTIRVALFDPAMGVRLLE